MRRGIVLEIYKKNIVIMSPDGDFLKIKKRGDVFDTCEIGDEVYFYQADIVTVNRLLEKLKGISLPKYVSSGLTAAMVTLFFLHSVLHIDLIEATAFTTYKDIFLDVFDDKSSKNDDVINKLANDDKSDKAGKEKNNEDIQDPEDKPLLTNSFDEQENQLENIDANQRQISSITNELYSQLSNGSSKNLDSDNNLVDAKGMLEHYQPGYNAITHSNDISERGKQLVIQYPTRQDQNSLNNRENNIKPTPNKSKSKGKGKGTINSPSKEQIEEPSETIVEQIKDKPIVPPSKGQLEEPSKTIVEQIKDKPIVPPSIKDEYVATDTWDDDKGNDKSPVTKPQDKPDLPSIPKDEDIDEEIITPPSNSNINLNATCEKDGYYVEYEEILTFEKNEAGEVVEVYKKMPIKKYCNIPEPIEENNNHSTIEEEREDTESTSPIESTGPEQSGSIEFTSPEEPTLGEESYEYTPPEESLSF